MRGPRGQDGSHSAAPPMPDMQTRNAAARDRSGKRHPRPLHFPVRHVRKAGSQGRVGGRSQIKLASPCGPCPLLRVKQTSLPYRKMSASGTWRTLQQSYHLPGQFTPGHRGRRGYTGGSPNRNSLNRSTRPREIAMSRHSSCRTSAWRQSSVPKPQAITLRQMPRREILPSSSSSSMPIYRLASFNGKNVALYLQLLSSHLSVTGLIVSISINDDARQRQRHGENSFHPPTPEDAAPTYRVRKAFPAHVHLRQREDA